MICPICRGTTKIARTEKYDTVVRRCRECVECGWHFNTAEEVMTENTCNTLKNDYIRSMAQKKVI